ncbi:MAG: MogA/MoaB family molybdenum cofactor biosynthesis protein [Nitrososphaerota archaeon]|jgi:molybdenum cofactor biosynthesis protein B|nr:MogA/MoaB family molybdenum cofactor biosynthesis protein [Nitrososphaerota archaeon]
MKSHEKHRLKARSKLRIAVITVSTSRYYAASEDRGIKDESGDLICRLARKAGHVIIYRSLVSDFKPDIRLKTLEAMKFQVDAIVLTGGTGVSPTDVTIEALQPMLDKELPGFGEAFRSESKKQVGYASMLSRALLGTMNTVVIACLPGSPDGVELGMKILLPELPHIVSIASGS